MPVLAIEMLALFILCPASTGWADGGLGDQLGVPVHGEPTGSTSRSEHTAAARAGAEQSSGGSDDIGLDRLLKLPSGMNFEATRRAGATEEQWRARFSEGRERLARAREALESSEKQLDEMASTGGSAQWQVAPPGSSQAETSPLSFKLREEIRSGRVRLEEAERYMRELHVEADLAGVPAAWQSNDPDGGSPPRSGDDGAGH